MDFLESLACMNVGGYKRQQRSWSEEHRLVWVADMTSLDGPVRM